MAESKIEANLASDEEAWNWGATGREELRRWWRWDVVTKAHPGLLYIGRGRGRLNVLPKKVRGTAEQFRGFAARERKAMVGLDAG